MGNNIDFPTIANIVLLVSAAGWLCFFVSTYVVSKALIAFGEKMNVKIDEHIRVLKESSDKRDAQFLELTQKVCNEFGRIDGIEKRVDDAHDKISKLEFQHNYNKG